MLPLFCGKVFENDWKHGGLKLKMVKSHFYSIIMLYFNNLMIIRIQ